MHIIQSKRFFLLTTPEEIRLAALAIVVTLLAPYMSCGQPINKAQAPALRSQVARTPIRVLIVNYHFK